MGGFASGFRAGYGLVNDTYEGIRREQQDAAQAEFNQNRIAAEQRRYDQGARYNRERLRLQERGLVEESRDRQRAFDLDGKTAADRQRELERQTELLTRRAEAEEGRLGIDQENAEGLRALREAQGRYSGAQADALTLELQQVRQRDVTRQAINELQQSGTLSTGTLINLQGTGINPAKHLAPDAEIQLKNSFQYALGNRTDYNSPDFAAAMNYLFETDTAVMIGQTPEGKDSPIVSQRIIGMEPVEDQPGSFRLVVQNQLMSGDVYDSYMTQGRKAGAPPAVITMEQLGSQLEANATAFEAFNRGELLDSLIINYTQISPEVNQMANNLRAQDVAEQNDVLSNKEYQRMAIGMLFGPIRSFASSDSGGGSAAGQTTSQPQAQAQAQPQRDPGQRPSIGEALAPIGDFLFGNTGVSPGARGNAGSLSSGDLAALNPNREPPQDRGTAAVNSVLSAPAAPSNQPPTIGEMRRAIMMQFRGSDQFVNELTDEEVLEYYRSGQITL